MLMSLPASDLERSKVQGSNLIYSTFRRLFFSHAENLHLTAPRPLFSCIDHTTIGRLIIPLHRKGQEIRSSFALKSQSTVRRAL
jgi:hypothetical protein